MRWSAWWGLGGLGGLVVVAACSSKDVPGDKYPTVDSYCDALAKAQCQEANFCEIDPTGCQTEVKKECLTASSAAQTSGRTYTPSKAPDCVDAQTKAYASATVSSTDLASLKDTCNRVFQGSVDKNGKCADSYQCAGDRICDKTLCGDKSVKKAGEGCANVGEVCDTGYYCTGTPMLCTARLGTNQACTAAADGTSECLESLRCLAGTCQPRVGIGAACANDADCTSDFCDPSTDRCGQALVFAPGTNLCNVLAGASPLPDAGPPAADAASE